MSDRALTLLGISAVLVLVALWLALTFWALPASADMLAAFRAQPQCRVGASKARRIVAEVQRVEARYALPSALLAAVVLAESGGLKLIARGRGKGGRGCDSGEGQIHVPDCDRRRLQRLLVLSTNLDRAGYLLARSRTFCAAHPRWVSCRRSEWARYNGGSPTWWGRVAKIWRRLRDAAIGEVTS